MVAWGVAAFALIVSAASAAIAAEPVPQPSVVVHLRDYQGIPAELLPDVLSRVTLFYGHAGVALDWEDGRVRPLPHDHRLHVDLIVLDAAMTARANPKPGSFGKGSHRARRAYIFYERVMAAAAGRNDPAVALSYVIAHELGHVLLPEHSHTRSGIMRPDWNGTTRRLPDFLPDQLVALRASAGSGR
jgi:hypothetical protein